MPSFKSFGLLAMTLLPLTLTACGGEGWELRKTNTTFPYGNQRTAGSGVEYVRAGMMPAKGPVLEQAPAAVEPPPAIEPEPEAPAPAAEPEPAPEAPAEEVKPADEVFNHMQRK